MDGETKKRSDQIVLIRILNLPQIGALHFLSAPNPTDGLLGYRASCAELLCSIGDSERYIRVTAEEEGFEPSRALRP